MYLKQFNRMLDKIPHKRKDLFIGLIFAILCIGVVAASWWAIEQYRTSAPYVDYGRFPIRGIDISAHNGMVNLQAVADAGYKFVFIKASEGENFRDENFNINYEKACNADLRIGAYHFYRFDSDPEKQAINLHKTINNRYLDLGIVIDVEAHGNPSGYSNIEISRGVEKMATELRRMGYHVLIYTNRDGYYDYIDSYNSLRDYSLWICSFYSDPLNAPWEFWQYDHHGTVPGVRGDVDLNAYSGSLNEWNNLFPNDDIEQ